MHEFGRRNLCDFFSVFLKDICSSLNAKGDNMNWANIFCIEFLTLMSICVFSSKFNLLSIFILSTQDTSMARIEIQFVAGPFSIEVMIYHDDKGRNIASNGEEYRSQEHQCHPCQFFSSTF